MYKLTTEHAASSYGTPVLVDEDGVAYGAYDTLPNGAIAAGWVASNMDRSDELIRKFLSLAPDLFD